MSYTYHHMGIPTTEKRPGELYHEEIGFTSTPFLANPYKIQWHRFDEDCELHPLLKEKPHIALKVPSIEKEIEGKNILLGPYEPIPGFRVAIIEFEGVPIEFVETDLSDEELASIEN